MWHLSDVLIYLQYCRTCDFFVLNIMIELGLILKGSVWKEKVENLEVELQQFYKAQSRLSDQLVVEVAESRTSKALVQEKEATILDLQNELTKARFDVFYYSISFSFFIHSYASCKILSILSFWQMIETNVHAAGMNVLN